MDMLLAHIEQIPVRTGAPTTEMLAERMSVLSKAVSMLQARAAGCVADQRALGSAPEGLTLTRWTAIHTDTSNAEARAVVGVARTMTRHSDTGDRIGAGELSHARARMLSRVAQAHPKIYERDEEMLLGFAENQTITHLNRALRYWRNCADDEMAADVTEDLQAGAYFHASVTHQGMVQVDGLLDPATGEALLTALDAATPPPTADDRRSAGNRRAMALGDICEQWLRNGTIDGGLRAAVSLTVDLDTLEGRYGKHCELGHTGPVTRQTAQRILCDADISRIVTRGDSEILDIGRATRTPTPAQRRALILRDRHCRYRGCERPPQWCDAHHIEPWTHGGDTNLDNLVLTCRYHHTLIHRGHAMVTGHDVMPRTAEAALGRAPP